MSVETLTLAGILGISYLGHNMSVVYATAILLVMKLLGLDSWFPQIESNGLNWGIIMLTVAILVPIATGRISLAVMMESFKSPLGIIAILAGIFAAVAGGLGIGLLKCTPEVVSSLIVGTMIGVFFFKGITVGPLIAGGMVYIVLTIGKFFQ